MKRLLQFLVALAVFAPLTICAQTTTLPVTWTWTAPTTGSPVHHYVVQYSNNGTTWTQVAAQPTAATITMSCSVGVPIQIRVAGVDATNRQGPWSEAADAFTPDAGAPGACGKPARQP